MSHAGPRFPALPIARIEDEPSRPACHVGEPARVSEFPLPIEERANDAIEPRIVEPKAVRELHSATVAAGPDTRDMSGLTPAERQRPKPQFASIHRDDATK